MSCCGPEWECGSRDAYFDNLKGLLIVLVVFGHLLEPLWNAGGAVQKAYLMIYAFHMPLFVFCSGWFSLRQTPKKLLCGVLYPYLVWQSLYSLFYRAALHQDFLALDYTTPVWVLWYLLSSLLWGLAAPLVSPKTKRGMIGAVALAVLLGLAAGYWDAAGYRFSLSRTIVFFPFYLWGRFCRARGTDPKRLGRVPVWVLTALGLAALLRWNDFSPGWFYEAMSYAQTGGSAAVRGFHYALAGGLCLTVLRLVPKTPTPLAGLGERSMQIFLLHGIAVRIFALQLPQPLPTWPVWALLPGALLGALLLAGLLGSRPVGRILGPLMRIKSGMKP